MQVLGLLYVYIQLKCTPKLSSHNSGVVFHHTYFLLPSITLYQWIAVIIEDMWLPNKIWFHFIMKEKQWKLLIKIFAHLDKIASLLINNELTSLDNIFLWLSYSNPNPMLWINVTYTMLKFLVEPWSSTWSN